MVVGGAVADLKMLASAPLVARTSNRGVTATSAGGVARNVAENVARLGHRVELVAPVGADAAGAELLAATASAGVGVEHVLATTFPTGRYLALLEPGGDLHIALSDMRATDELTIVQVEPVRDVVAGAAILMLDGNLPEQVYVWLVELAARTGVPVVVDPVSVVKAGHLSRTLDAGRPLFVLTPNLDELSAILQAPVEDTVAAIADAAGWFHERGVANLWVRRGILGSVLSILPDGAPVGTAPQVHVLSAPTCTVRDVTGAGDSMTAGFIHAWLDGADVVTAAQTGQALASLTVEATQTVRSDLTPDLVRSRLHTHLSSSGVMS